MYSSHSDGKMMLIFFPRVFTAQASFRTPFIEIDVCFSERKSRFDSVESVGTESSVMRLFQETSRCESVRFSEIRRMTLSEDPVKLGQIWKC